MALIMTMFAVIGGGVAACVAHLLTRRAGGSFRPLIAFVAAVLAGYVAMFAYGAMLTSSGPTNFITSARSPCTIPGRWRSFASRPCRRRRRR